MSGFRMHFQFTLGEYLATGRYICESDFKSVPRMICNTGDGHAVGTRKWGKVTCERCLLRKPKTVIEPTDQEILDNL